MYGESGQADAESSSGRREGGLPQRPLEQAPGRALVCERQQPVLALLPGGARLHVEQRPSVGGEGDRRPLQAALDQRLGVPAAVRLLPDDGTARAARDVRAEREPLAVWRPGEPARLDQRVLASQETHAGASPEIVDPQGPVPGKQRHAPAVWRRAGRARDQVGIEPEWPNLTRRGQPHELQPLLSAGAQVAGRVHERAGIGDRERSRPVAPDGDVLEHGDGRALHPASRRVERRGEHRPVRAQGQEVTRGDVAGKHGRDAEAVELTGPQVQDRCLAPWSRVGIHEEARSPAREQLRPDQDPRRLLAVYAHVLGRRVDHAALGPDPPRPGSPRRRRDDRAVFAPAPPEILGYRGDRLGQPRHEGELLELSRTLAPGRPGPESNPEAVGREERAPGRVAVGHELCLAAVEVVEVDVTDADVAVGGRGLGHERQLPPVAGKREHRRGPAGKRRSRGKRNDRADDGSILRSPWRQPAADAKGHGGEGERPPSSARASSISRRASPMSWSRCLMGRSRQRASSGQARAP